MKWSTRSILVAAVAVAVSGGFAGAQQTEETRRQRRMEEAQRRAQEAQEELAEALRLMAEAEGDEARQRLDASIREMQAARSRLGYGGLITGYTGPGELFLSTTRSGAPQMGVYLNTERRRSTDSIGVVLNSVVEEGPAYEAGLRDGDIITVANGESVARTGRVGTSPANKLIRIKDDLEEGDILHVEYRRGATTHEADIEVRYLDNYSMALGNYSRALGIAAPEITVLDRDGQFNIRSVFSGQLSLLGMLDVELIELDEELGWYFGVQEGLLVVRAPDDDDLLELRSGDVIVSIDGRRPRSQTQLVRILRSYEEGETMQFTIMRQREEVTIDVTVPERDGDFFWRRERQ